MNEKETDMKYLGHGFAAFHNAASHSAGNERSAIIWNMIGSGLNASMTFVLTLCITRFCNVEMCGVFAIGYAIAQLMWTVGMFEEGTYQVTDASGNLTFPQYTGFKIISCVLMAIISPLYVLYMHFTMYKAGIAILLCMLKMTDAASNLYFSLFQQHGRLDISGFSMAVRDVLAMVMIALTLWITDGTEAGLALSIFLASVVSVIWIFLYEVREAKAFAPIRPDFNPKAMRRLFFQCLPLFVSTFLINYIYNIPKYGIEQFFDDVTQAHFNYVYSVAFIMNLFSLFALKPLQTQLTAFWASGEDLKFKKSVGRVCGVMAAISLGLAALFSVFGPAVLGWVYGVNLSAYNFSFFLVLLGGGISAIINVLYNAVTVMRLQRFLLIGYGGSAILTLILSPYLISAHGVLGACWSFIASMLIILILFIGIFLLGLRRKEFSIIKFFNFMKEGLSGYEKK